MLEPGGSGSPLMLATVAFAETLEPPITTSAEVLAGANSWIPLLRIGSNLLVYSWSRDVAVVVTAKVLKSATGNEVLPASETSKAMSFVPTLTPESFLLSMPNSRTVTFGWVLVGSDRPVMGIG